MLSRSCHTILQRVTEATLFIYLFIYENKGLSKIYHTAQEYKTI